MSADQENIVARIRKLLALADKGEGNEAEVAAKMASKLMTKHAVSLSSLTEAEIREQDPVLSDAFIVGQASWKIQLAWAIASHCNVSAIRSRQWDATHPVTREQHPKAKRNGYNVWAVGFGHKSDLQVWEYLYNVALRAINKEAKAWRAQENEERAEDCWGQDVTRAEMNRFRMGAVGGLRGKLKEIRQASRQAATATSQETGIVLASRRERGLALRDQTHPRLGTYSSSVHGNSAGYAAGRRININSGLTGRTSSPKQLN
tara:strand:- start:981 stop:1763 length:783 start_codon:yes stop_codon:yes gene_type:complete